jgi:hypothetical protein
LAKGDSDDELDEAPEFPEELLFIVMDKLFDRNIFPLALAVPGPSVKFPIRLGLRIYSSATNCVIFPFMLLIPLCWFGPLITEKLSKEGGIISSTFDAFSTIY